MPNDEIERCIVAGELDLGVGFVLPNHNNVDSELLFKERWKVVTSQKHEDQLDKILVGEYRKLKAMMFPENFQTRKVINQYFKQKGIKFDQITEVNSINSMFDLVENGNAFTILPEAFSVLKNKQQLASRYIDDLPPRQVGILTQKRNEPKKSIEKFRSLIFQQLHNKDEENE